MARADEADAATRPAQGSGSKAHLQQELGNDDLLHPSPNASPGFNRLAAGTDWIPKGFQNALSLIPKFGDRHASQAIP
jgi:hypothetical protein